MQLDFATRLASRWQKRECGAGAVRCWCSAGAGVGLAGGGWFDGVLRMLVPGCPCMVHGRDTARVLLILLLREITPYPKAPDQKKNPEPEDESS